MIEKNNAIITTTIPVITITIIVTITARTAITITPISRILKINITTTITAIVRWMMLHSLNHVAGVHDVDILGFPDGV